MILYTAAKTGRIPERVETKDTEPLAIAQNCKIAASNASTSLKMSKVKVEFLRFLSLNCLMMLGRAEAIWEMAVKYACHAEGSSTKYRCVRPIHSY